MKKILLFSVSMFILGIVICKMSFSEGEFVHLGLANIEALAESNEGSGGCTASLSCSLASDNDYVSCSGKTCSRNPVERWVECDGSKTYCTTVK